MNSQELATAKAVRGAPADPGHGQLPVRHHPFPPGSPLPGPHLRNAAGEPDFGVLGEGYGGYGARLDNNDDIERVISEAMKATPEEIASPPWCTWWSTAPRSCRACNNSPLGVWWRNFPPPHTVSVGTSRASNYFRRYWHEPRIYY